MCVDREVLQINVDLDVFQAELTRFAAMLLCKVKTRYAILARHKGFGAKPPEPNLFAKQRLPHDFVISLNLCSFLQHGQCDLDSSFRLPNHASERLNEMIDVLAAKLLLRAALAHRTLSSCYAPSLLQSS